MTVYHLLVKNNYGREGGLKREEGLLNFLPLKNSGLIREKGLIQEGGGGGGLIADLGIGFTVLSPPPKIVKLIFLYK